MVEINADIARLLFSKLRVDLMIVVHNSKLLGQYLTFRRANRELSTFEIHSIIKRYLSTNESYQKYVTIILHTTLCLRLVSSQFATVTPLEIALLTHTDYGVKQHSQLIHINTRLTSLEHKKYYCYQLVITYALQKLLVKRYMYDVSSYIKIVNLLNKLLRSAQDCPKNIALLYSMISIDNIHRWIMNKLKFRRLLIRCFHQKQEELNGYCRDYPFDLRYYHNLMIYAKAFYVFYVRNTLQYST